MACQPLSDDGRGEHFVERGIGAHNDLADRPGPLPKAANASLEHERRKITALAISVGGRLQIERAGLGGR